MWPTSLEQLTFDVFLGHLSFGDCLNQPVVEVSWPHFVKHLSFGGTSNQPIAATVWPSSLQELPLGFNFNQQPVTGVLWPQSPCGCCRSGFSLTRASLKSFDHALCNSFRSGRVSTSLSPRPCGPTPCTNYRLGIASSNLPPQRCARRRCRWHCPETAPTGPFPVYCGRPSTAIVREFLQPAYRRVGLASRFTAAGVRGCV